MALPFVASRQLTGLKDENTPNQNRRKVYRDIFLVLLMAQKLRRKFLGMRIEIFAPFPNRGWATDLSLCQE
jgi:hypothetical protein